MTPQELANEVASIVADAQDRILGIGAEQYHTPGKPQKFETMPQSELLAYFEEELIDQINYAAMNIIRLRRLRKALEGVI